MHNGGYKMQLDRLFSNTRVMTAKGALIVETTE